MTWAKGSDSGLSMWTHPSGHYSVVREGRKVYSVRASSGVIGGMTVCKEIDSTETLADAMEMVEQLYADRLIREAEYERWP